MTNLLINPEDRCDFDNLYRITINDSRLIKRTFLVYACSEDEAFYLLGTHLGDEKQFSSVAGTFTALQKHYTEEEILNGQFLVTDNGFYFHHDHIHIDLLDKSNHQF